MHGLLNGLTGLNEPRQRAVHLGRPVGVSRQQHFFALGDQHDDARRQPRVVDEAAALATHGAVLAVKLHGRSTAPAKLVAVSVPKTFPTVSEA